MIRWLMPQTKAIAVAARSFPSKIVPFSNHQPKPEKEASKNSVNQDSPDFFIVIMI